MAKKRKNQKRKHNQNNNEQSDFLADVPESQKTMGEENEWNSDMETQNNPNENLNNSNESHEANNPKVEMNDSSNLSNVDDSPEASPVVEQSHQATEESMPNYQESASSQEQVSFEPQTEESIPGHTIGPHLKNERERLGIQLKNVGQSTKISLTNLENLESDNLEALPDKAYVTGYVKSYAKLLNLNTSEALKLLDYTYEKFGKDQGPQEIVIPQAQNAPTVSAPLPIAKIAAGVIGVLIVIALVVTIWMSLGDSSETNESAVEEKTSIQENEAIENENTEITPQTLTAETPLQEELPEATPSVSEDDESQSLSTETKENNAEEEPAPTPTKTVQTEKKEADSTQNEEQKEEEKEETEEKQNFYKMARTLYSFDEDMSQDRINELLPSRFRVNPAEGIYSVFITASKGDSWLTYKSDDEEIRKFVLKEGRSILIRGKLTRVFIGNLGAVNIFLNNKPLKISSSSGVKSLIFPQEQSSNFVTPLFIYKKDGSVITSEEYLEENPQ